MLSGQEKSKRVLCKFSVYVFALFGVEYENGEQLFALEKF